MRIYQLPPLISNQIAAGEVIERPASVVKELLENSLDAGADTIAVEIGYGGLNQIKISDNGGGIFAEDLPLAVAAHATSKINTLNDLYAIQSMGFRGEALASIASVARLTISSKPAEQDTAMMLQVQNGHLTVTPCARAMGTTIDVVDLFFNAPVRKRFLKSEKLEFQAIETVIKRFALGAPHVTLTLKHNGKQVLSLPAARHEQAQLTRITRILGSPFVKDSIYLDVESGTMRLYGWISGPAYQRSQNDRQWVYINQRMVKDKLINHALKQAYDEVLHPGRFPACVLYFSINHAEVDVNVHPTKHEVRFQQPRLVHDFFSSQLKAALGSKAANNEEVEYEPSQPLRAQINEICEPYPRLLALNAMTQSIDAEAPWVILNNQYVLAFIKQQPYVVDVMALQRYAVQEDLAQAVLPLASRPLLVPVRSNFSSKGSKRILELSHNLAQLGIHLEVSGEYEVLVRTLPVSLPYLDLRLFLDTVMESDILQLEQLLELLSQTQAFDSRMLSHEEQFGLNQILIRLQGEESKKQGLFKVFTVDDCRNLLHV